MSAGIRFGYFLLYDYLGYTAESLIISSDYLLSSFLKRIKFFQLAYKKSRLKIRQSVIISETDLFIIPGSFMRGLFHHFFIVSDPVCMGKDQLFVVIFIIGGYRSAFAAGYGFDGMKTESRHIRKRAYRS